MMVPYLYVFLYLISMSCASSFRPKYEKSIKNGQYLSTEDLGSPDKYEIVHKHLRSNNICSNNNVPALYITDFGGDPHGINDSTSAFEQAIFAALTKYGAPKTFLANNITDLGGITIDLGGGDYLVSRPLTIPSMYGNLRIIDGTIRASNNFTPSSAYLLNIGNITFDCINNGNVCNENIGVENVMLDGRQNCFGGLHVWKTIGSMIGPQVFVVGYTSLGIAIHLGHEAMISYVWLGQYYWSDVRRGTSMATSIEITAADCYIFDTIVFGGRIGLNLPGWDNVIQGLHTWNMGPGIIVTGHNNRITNCYLDGNDIFLYSPIQTIILKNTMFLYSSKLQLVANQTNAEIKSLSFVDSIYSDGGYKDAPTIFLNETNGFKFTMVQNMKVNGILLNKDKGTYHKLKTSATDSVLTLKNSTKWVFDFNEVLLFGDNIGINWVEYSLQIDDSSINRFAQHAVRLNNSRIVIVETNKPVDGTVYIKVDQSKHDPYA